MAIVDEVVQLRDATLASISEAQTSEALEKVRVNVLG